MPKSCQYIVLLTPTLTLCNPLIKVCVTEVGCLFTPINHGETDYPHMVKDLTMLSIEGSLGESVAVSVAWPKRTKAANYLCFSCTQSLNVLP